MKKLLTLTAVTLLATVSAASAADASDISADKGAIAKDNAAIAKQDGNISQNRADKEAAKTNGDTAAQATESVKIGANQTAKTFKKGEKDVDQRILNHDSSN